MEIRKTAVLVVDDEKNIRDVLKAELDRSRFDVFAAENGTRAYDLMQKQEFDVLLLDLNMAGMSGMDVLRCVRDAECTAEVVILTANATVESAVDAMKLGAFDYLRKPFDLEELEAVLQKAAETGRLRRDNAVLKTQLKREFGQPDFVADSAPMRVLMEAVRKVAKTDFSVLITGESGVGKELIARTIHEESGRAEGPFIAINCGALPESMIESELFGHEKGAFTGAASRKLGLLELSDGGTLFLDEIGDMPFPLQVKLLRVLETSRFYRLGGMKEHQASLRIVAATNRDLKNAIAAGAFRSDLYYRISGMTVHVPPLRERADDIPALVDHIRKSHSAFLHKSIDADALRVLQAYAWPGNIRELQNVLQRALLLSPGPVVRPADLPADLSAARRGADAQSTRLEDVEREHILRTLAGAGGQRERAADLLGISERTLRRKLKDFGE